MARYYAGSTITLQQVVTVHDVLTDEPAIGFTWKMGLYGTENSVVPTHASTGVYTVAIVPPYGGDLYFRWDTTTNGVLDTAQEGALAIADSKFSAFSKSSPSLIP